VRPLAVISLCSTLRFANGEPRHRRDFWIVA
jgi:hypothetical protein